MMLTGKVFYAIQNETVWQSEFADNTSSAYIALTKRLCRSLYQANVAGNSSFLAQAPMACQIARVYSGSVYAQALIMYQLTSSQTDSVTSAGILANLLYGASIIGDPGMLNLATSISGKLVQAWLDFHWSVFCRGSSHWFLLAQSTMVECCRGLSS
ncbi:unnamed protein product [Schistocephalus solidus]|uniref:Fungal_trans domain-containing protein n=1 Tax=Schistocephalus solidus TaxID=70667 RepID=A0A183TME4_SCHSO|nr:unnamed protein product [Schistocephalus solidus]